MAREYEMHLTLEPMDSADMYREKLSWEEFVKRSAELGWKASKFEHDDVDGIAGKWFLTSHADTEAGALSEIRGMAHGLSSSDFTVLRAKVEHVIFDTKAGDTL